MLKDGSEKLGSADVDYDGAEFFSLLMTNAGDGLELGDGEGTLEHDAAQRGGAEDEELRQADAFGFGLPPGAELLVEEELFGSEVGGGVGGNGAGTVKSWGGFGAGV
jgi:hypothetical protein